MRRIEREALDPETINGLDRLQEEVEAQREQAGFDPSEHWKRRRDSRQVLAVFETLKRMAGQRERCMYCVDSEACDIEHFRPKSLYVDLMYRWDNLLIACAQCGRFKGKRFPRADDGAPLLIDPSAEEPWDFLEFDPITGNLNARYLSAVQSYSPKGEATVEVLHLDRREGISVGYRKSYRRLCKLVTEWCDNQLSNDYVGQLRENDDHGLLGWFLHGSGKNEPAFVRFRGLYPEEWAICKQSLH